MHAVPKPAPAPALKPARKSTPAAAAPGGLSAVTQAYAPIRRGVRLIVLHCSATPSGQPITQPGAGAGNAADVIDAWHAARGFARSMPAREAFNRRLGSIGYHFVIDLDGTPWRGRHLNEAGAHVAGFNADSIGICLVGGAERDARYTAAQWGTLARLVRELCGRLQMVPLLPLYPRQGRGVCGHRDLSPDANGDGAITSRDWLKTCPGFDVGAWLARGMQPAPEQVFPTERTA